MIYSWHKPTWDKFKLARAKDHLPHAILISGDDGIGKTQLSNSMVKSLLCTSSDSQNNNYHACNTCQACKTYGSGANPDYLHISLLEGKQQIAVDQIRELSNFLNYTSSLSSNRVILINPVERMNKNAANSLLKSLEEPTKNTILLLVTSNLSSIIPTIKSRCQLLAVKNPTQAQSLKWLEKYGGNLSNPELSLQFANGKPLQAVDINDGVINRRDELATNILALLDEKLSITEVAKKWEKFDLTTLLDWQLYWVQAFIKNHETSTEVQLKIGTKIEEKHKWELYQQLIKKKKLVHTSVNPLMLIESMLISWKDNKSL